LVRKTHREGHVEELISMYDDYKRKIAEQRGDIIEATAPKPEVMIYGHGATGAPTESRAMRLCNDESILYMEAAVKAVDLARKDFAFDPRQEVIWDIVKRFYVKGDSLQRVCYDVKYSQNQVIRLKKAFVRKVMERLGWS
jgi:hypothetical protein